MKRTALSVCGRILIAGGLMCLVSQCGVRRPIPSSGLLLWLRADAGVTHNGPRVARWADQSGNGNDAIQPDEPRQPLFVKAGLNGRPTIHFDGIDDRLGLTGSTHMSRISLFIVFQIDSGDGGDPVVFGDVDADGREWGIDLQSQFSGFSPDTVNVYSGLNGRAQAFLPNCATVGQWHSFSVVTDRVIWNTTLRANGVDARIVHDGTNMYVGVPLGNMSGTGVGGIGGVDGLRPPFYRFVVRCGIAELILYDTVLSDSERRAVERYLAEKYGLLQSAAERK